MTIDWFLPGTNSGGPVRSYANMISHLEDDFEFYVITRDTDYCSDRPYDTINPNTWNKIDPNTNVYYFSNTQLNIPNLKKIINEVDAEILMVNGIYSWYFSILPVLLYSKKRKIIVSARGMLNPQAFLTRAKRKLFFLQFANKLKFYKNVSFHATNEIEKNYIANRIKTFSEIKVASNLPRKITQRQFSKTKKGKPVRFVSLGRISPEKGLLRALRYLEHIDSEIIFDIFGPIYHDSYWQECKKLIDRLPKNISIEYKGIIDSDEVLKTLSNYDFFMFFTEGENFGHVILESFSAGLPVIISNKTPWQDLKKINVGWALNVDDEVEVLSTIKEAISMANETYLKMSQSAKAFAIEFSSNPELIKQNKNLFI